MISLYWKRGDAEGYADILPAWWFDSDGSLADVRHDVRGPKGGLKTVRCALRVAGNTADIDYAGEHTAFNERIFPVGATRLVFRDTRRRELMQVQWRGVGKRRFSIMSADDVDWTMHVDPIVPPTFDPTDMEDGRKRIEQAVVVRQGQPTFRKVLLRAYGRRCAITDCAVEGVLEAAHISPYRGERTNHVSNGLLLRADIHTLFDLGLIRVDSDYRITASADVAAAYELPAKIRLPVDPSMHPSKAAFEAKWSANG